MADRQRKLRDHHARKVAARAGEGTPPSSSAAAAARSLFGRAAPSVGGGAPAGDGTPAATPADLSLGARNGTTGARNAARVASHRRGKGGGAETGGGRDENEDEEGRREQNRGKGRGNLDGGGSNLTGSQRAAFRASQRGSATGGSSGGSATGPPPIDARDAMKRLFAARRRQARLEMAAAAASSSLNTSTASISSGTASVNASANTSVASEEGGEGDKSVSAWTTSGSSKPSRSAKSGATITHSSRRALDRYLGRSRGNPVGGASVGSARSGISGTSGIGGGTGNGSGGPSNGGSSGIPSGVADSPDNHRPGSRRGKDSTRPPVPEGAARSASASSMSTAVTDNTSNRSGARQPSGANATDANGEPGGGTIAPPAGPGGILRANSKDELPEKSVRFRPSPLEKQKRRLARGEGVPPEEPSGQCSPPRRGGEGSRASSAGGGNEEAENEAGRDRGVEGGGEEDAEFARFVAGLRKEVAGDHAELWSGFQSLLGRPPSHRVPLDPSAAAAADDRNGPTTKKKVRMDPATQASLAAIHKSLMENGRVKGKFMTTTCQLANDRRVRKDRAKRGRPGGGGGASAAVPTAAAAAAGPTRSEATDGGRSGGRWAGERNGATETDRGAAGSSDEEGRRRPPPSAHESRRPSHTEEARGAPRSGSAPRRPGDRAPAGGPTAAPAPSSASSAPSSSGGRAPRAAVAPRRVGGTAGAEPGVDEDGRRSVGSIEGDGTEKPKPGWMEALRQKQKSLKLKALEEHSDTSSPSGGAEGTFGNGAMARLRRVSPRKGAATAGPSGGSDGSIGNGAMAMLRRVSPRKKARTTPPSTPETPAAPWSRTQLRSTPKKRESMNPAPNLNPARPALSPVGSRNGRAAAAASGPAALPPADGGPNAPKSTEAPSPPPPPCAAGDVIDLDHPPPRLFPDGIVAAFPLKKYPARPAKLVLVGTDSIVTVATVQPRKATVAWHGRRAEVRALTLNVAATGATLAHARGRTPLLFETADACLEFCRAFYRGPTTRTLDGEASGGASSSATAAGASHEAPESVAPPSAPTGREAPPGLTEDEESLLDRYRRYSRGERTKLRLTRLSPRGEMEEAEVSPLPEASAPSNDAPTPGNGTSVDEEAAAKFRAMRKMGVPSDAVRHKMTTEGVDAATISAVLDEPPPAGSKGDNGLSPDEEEVASKYRKMLKMGVPADGVRHKMTTEGAAANIIRAVLAPPSQEDEAGPPSSRLAGEEEVVASKYRKMLKMGVPLEGVEHKMKQDGIDPKIVSALVAEASASSPEGGAGGASVDPPVSKSKGATSAAGPALAEDEEAMASKYRNMLKVCIPKDAVRHKMKQEGVSGKVMEAVLGKEGNAGGGADGAPGGAAPSKAQNRKTIAFHWTTSNLAPELLEQSIFGRTELLKKRKLASINPEEADIKKLEELFQKRNNTATGKMKAGGGQEDADNDMAKLLDLTRANNIAISLKAFNDFTFRSLAETIADLDPDCKIVGERVQFVPNLLPTPKEIQAVKKYKGDDDKLVTAELFFRQLVPIKRIEDKVKVMRTMSTFEEHVEEARAGFKTLQTVCAQVMNSEKLIQILDMVLNVGNLMNEGTLDGGVDAFKFESLPKLSQTKSADGKTTVLDYIVETFIEKGERRALRLLSEFPDIQDSSRLSIGDLVGDVTGLRADYKLCKTELASMKRDQSSKRATRSMAKKVKDESEVADPRKALFAAIQSRGAGEEATPESGDPRQALFAAIKAQKKGASPNEDGDSPTKSDVKYSPGVLRLQKFLHHSKTTLSLAGQDQDAAIRACKGLAVYCGEGGGERAAAPLLQVLSEFALSLESGVKRYDARLEAEKKKAAKKKKDGEKGKENNGRKDASTTLASRKFLKASSLQPHAGATAKVNKPSLAASGEENADPMTELLSAIKGRGSQKTSQKNASPKMDPKEALLESIKQRRESLPAKPPPDGVPERVKHINNTLGRKESRVLLVNRMLSEAPASVRQDFLKGVTYKETDDPLLKKIYEKEDSPKNRGEDEVEKKWKPVDPRQELFAAIRSRKT